MPVTNYYTIDGEITAEKTTGGSRVDYLTDALGSVTATMDQSAQVVNTYRYKPYGAQLAKTGVGSDPNFQWVGSQGYRQTGKKYSDVYVRARHYGDRSAHWTTKDTVKLPLNAGSTYGYAFESPVYGSDPSGLVPEGTAGCCTQSNIDQFYTECLGPACPGGRWEPFNASGDSTLCSDQLRRDRTDMASARRSCAAIADRLHFLLEACVEGNVPPQNRADLDFSPWASTFCCCNGTRMSFCAIRTCPSNTGYPTGSGVNACLRSCLFQHEVAHSFMCGRDACGGNLVANNPALRQGGNPREGCAHGVEGACLGLRYRTICMRAGMWTNEMDVSLRRCQMAVRNCRLVPIPVFMSGGPLPQVM